MTQHKRDIDGMDPAEWPALVGKTVSLRVGSLVLYGRLVYLGEALTAVQLRDGSVKLIQTTGVTAVTEYANYDMKGCG